MPDHWSLFAILLSRFSPLGVNAIKTQHHLLQNDLGKHCNSCLVGVFMESAHNASKNSISMLDTNPDTMHLEEALCQPNCAQFIKAIRKEMNKHIQRKHWKVVPTKSIPLHKRPIPMVWWMKHKRNLLVEIVKWKACLCAGGPHSIKHVDHWSTYSPAASWSTVQLMIIFALINNWHMQSIDFVLAFPQAPVKIDIYMQPPKVLPDVSIPDLLSYCDCFNHVYKLIKNLYGLKDAGKTWFEFLCNNIPERGWKQSKIDQCPFTKDNSILFICVNSAILIFPDTTAIDLKIRSL